MGANTFDLSIRAAVLFSYSVVENRPKKMDHCKFAMTTFPVCWYVCRVTTPDRANSRALSNSKANLIVLRARTDYFPTSLHVEAVLKNLDIRGTCNETQTGLDRPWDWHDAIRRFDSPITCQASTPDILSTLVSSLETQRRRLEGVSGFSGQRNIASITLLANPGRTSFPWR